MDSDSSSLDSHAQRMLHDLHRLRGLFTNDSWARISEEVATRLEGSCRGERSPLAEWGIQVRRHVVEIVYTALWNEHRQQLLVHFHHLCQRGPYRDYEDVVQHVMTRLLEELGRVFNGQADGFDSPAKFLAWARVTGRNYMVDENRHWSSRRLDTSRLSVDVQETLLSSGHAGECNPSYRLEQADSRRIVNEELARLSDNERRVVVATYCEAKKCAAVANAEGKSTAAIYKILERVRKRLRAVLLRRL